MEKYVEVAAENRYKTDEAVRFYDGDEPFWVPKLVMKEWPDLGQTGIALIKTWFAKKKKII